MDKGTTRWDAAAGFLLAVHTVFLLSWWPLLPLFVDAYYHLNVVQGFREAGGIVLHDFWEWAPQGRPHLYPPALHIAWLGLDWLHLSAINLARAMSVTAYVASMAAAWWAARQWLGQRTAYWVMVCALLPWSYLLACCNTVAAAWAMVGWLVSLVAIGRRALIAAVLCGALVFYTHLGTPWLMLASWIMIAAGDGSRRKLIIQAAFFTLLLAGPWLGHLWRYRQAIVPVSTFENSLIEMPFFIWLFAAVGMRRTQQAGYVRLALFGLLIGSGLLLWRYAYRFFSGQGLLPVVIFAAIGLDSFYQALQRRMPKQPAFPGWFIALALTGLLFMFSPVWRWGHETKFLVSDSALARLVSQDQKNIESDAVSLYYPRFIDPLVSIIAQHSQPEELIGCNQPYTCGLLAALSRRAMVVGMLAEVRPELPVSGRSLFQKARLLIWLKQQPIAGVPEESTLAGVLGFRKIAETDFATVWQNTQPGERKKAARPVVSLLLAQLFLLFALVCIAADLRRHRAVSLF